LSPSNLEKSRAFQAKEGKKQCEHVLQPRFKGYQLCHEKLREKIDAVYDLTLGFPDKVPQSEATILKGDWPAEVHIHCRRIPHSELPVGDEAVAAWVEQNFEKKEAILAKFAELKRFEEEPVDYGGISTLLRSTALIWLLVVSGFFYMLYQYRLMRWGCLGMLVNQWIVTKLGGVDKLERSLYKAKQASGEQKQQ